VIIRAEVGDVATVATDVVVNAANNSLGPGTGVNGAIRRAGGPGLCAEMDEIGHCPTGEAVSTAGHDLPARWVIHTVGPVWHGGGKGEADLLASCYLRSIELADRVGARSIVFAAVSTGVYVYPARAGAGVAVRTLRDLRPASVEDCLLLAFDPATLALYDELLTSA
jgi:O-acetyl-ADP-ribose deacetylase (regulator of RNase III)